MSNQNQAALVVACPECDVRAELDSANEAVAMYRRHRGVTGHDLVWDRADLDVDEVPRGGVETVLEELDERFEDGVPVGVVTAAMSRQGVSIAETLEELYDLRMAGRLHEPTDDHLSTI